MWSARKLNAKLPMQPTRDIAEVLSAGEPEDWGSDGRRVPSKVEMKPRSRVIEALVSAFPLLFIVQVFIFAWCTGAFVRNEQSPYLWVFASEHVRRFGIADTVLGVGLYLLYYCFLIEVPVLFLWTVLMGEKPAARRYDPLICGGWVLVTFLIFADSILQFLRSLPVTGGSQDWLLIAWVASTAVAGMACFRLIRARLKEYRSAYCGEFGMTIDRYEQFLLRHNLLNRFFEEEASAREASRFVNSIEQEASEHEIPTEPS
jgi:hypothetical protein